MVVAMVLQQTKGFIMAKQIRQETILSAIKSVTAAMRIDAIANPTEEQKMERQNAMLNAADVIDDSGIMTLAEHGDDTIDTAHQVDAIYEQAGIDPVQLRRDGAIAGAVATVTAIEAGQALEAGEQEALEAGEQVEPTE